MGLNFNAQKNTTNNSRRKLQLKKQYWKNDKISKSGRNGHYGEVIITQNCEFGAELQVRKRL